MKKTTLFLDIDWVLNNGKNREDMYGFDIDPRNIRILKCLLTKLGDYEIVLSSDWKYCEKPYLDYFSLCYNLSFVGHTEKLTLSAHNYTREELRVIEIQNYIKAHNISKYYVLDDLDLSVLPFAYKVNGKTGLMQEDITSISKELGLEK